MASDQFLPGDRPASSRSQRSPPPTGRERKTYTRRCRCCDQRKPVRGGRRYRMDLGAIYFLCRDCDQRHLAPLRIEQRDIYWAAVVKLLAPALAGQVSIERRAFEVSG